METWNVVCNTSIDTFQQTTNGQWNSHNGNIAGDISQPYWSLGIYLQEDILVWLETNRIALLRQVVHNWTCFTYYSKKIVHLIVVEPDSYFDQNALSPFRKHISPHVLIDFKSYCFMFIWVSTSYSTHCILHITMGSFMCRWNQYIQLVKVLYCKLLTNSKLVATTSLPAWGRAGIQTLIPEVGGWSVTSLPPWPSEKLLKTGT